MNAKSNLHLNAPFCNQANDYSLDCLEMVINYSKFTAALGNQVSGNIFQCVMQSGWVDCISWLDLLSHIGSEEIKFVEERKFRRQVGVGFEIWSGKC